MEGNVISDPSLNLKEKLFKRFYPKFKFTPTDSDSLIAMPTIVDIHFNMDEKWICNPIDDRLPCLDQF